MTISELTRRNLFDVLRLRRIAWSGRLEDIEFLERLDTKNIDGGSELNLNLKEEAKEFLERMIKTKEIDLNDKLFDLDINKIIEYAESVYDIPKKMEYFLFCIKEYRNFIAQNYVPEDSSLNMLIRRL